jgi:hypothetical protein
MESCVFESENIGKENQKLANKASDIVLAQHQHFFIPCSQALITIYKLQIWKVQRIYK